MDWRGGRWKLREGLQQEIRAFFLRKAAKKKNQAGVSREVERGTKAATGGQGSGHAHAVSAEDDLVRGNSAGDHLRLFLFGGGDDGRGVPQQLIAEEIVIGAFQEEIANDRHEHADGLDDV